MRTTFAVLLALVVLPPLASPHAVRPIIIRGTVTDAATHAPLIGAVVKAVGSTSAAPTDSAGRYVLRVSVQDHDSIITVSVGRIGYEAASRSTKVADSVTADFALKAVSLRLEQVVVTDGAQSSKRVSAAYGVPQLRVASPAAQQSGIHLRGAAARPLASARGDTTRRWNTEEYGRIYENPFLRASTNALSTFSIDVDRASYSNVRRYINDGTLPPKDAVRVEELINYFPYDYAAPTGRDPLSITTDVTAAPWNTKHRVVRIGLQAPRIETAKLPPNNLAFLIDVSGSMMDANKLPLVKQSLRLLVDQLREQDRVAIVVYAGNAGLVLPSTPGFEKERILDAIMSLEAGGSTAGGAGIRLAYDVAKQNFMPRGNNRVILATDGDFNVGVSSTSELVRLIEERRAEGTFLSVLGFGVGNLKDGRMEQLADKGNGNYAYIESLLEARKVLVQEMGGTLVTVAKDVKLQVEFNPSRVQAYRLIGYENRLLRNEDFADDTKDAGEMGAGHSVTALYEVIPAGVALDVKLDSAPKLRYQEPATQSAPSSGDELLFVKVRYKEPAGSTSRLMEHAVRDRGSRAGDDFRFVLAVAGYGMLLRDSEFKGSLTYDAVAELARAAMGRDPNGYRADFVRMVEKTGAIRVAQR